jgi:hypothetical protein
LGGEDSFLKIQYYIFEDYLRFELCPSSGVLEVINAIYGKNNY